MCAGLHDHKLAFGDRFQLIRCHERPLHHLQRLVGFVLSLADRSAQHGTAAQRFGQCFGGLALWRETAKNRVLCVIYNDFCTFFAIIPLQLCQTLNDRHQCQLPGPASRKQRQDIEGRHGTQLITEQDNAILQFPAVLISYSKQFAAEVLDHESSHKVFAGIFLRENEEHSRFMTGKTFGIHIAVEAQHLLQF